MATQTTPSVEQAIRVILEKNFDADSKVCFLTLLKILDNILQKPGNEKVRALRTGNATIKSKILDNHGHHLLMACGFVHEPADIKWQTEERLVLPTKTENTELLVKARHTLARIGVLELGLQSTDIPKYKPPPAPVAMAASSSSNNNSSGGFDVYSGSRFDGQSAALGTDLSAPKNWKSKTEQELQALKQREQKLQRQLQQPKGLKVSSAAAPTIDRQWTVFLPGQNPPPTAESSSIGGTTSSKGDASLLASHFKQQHAKRVAADNRGFTTKAMRDLEKLKKTKVYSHTQLAIHFPDGISVKANFSTTEKVQMVMDGLFRDVLFSTDTLSLPPLELYQTPPRMVLDSKQTLQALGLVPAAKVYVSWKQPLPTNVGGLGKGWYIQQHLLQGPTAAATATGPALATSVPVLQSQSTQSSASSGSTKPADATTTKRKKTRAEKEAAMMKRMLGKR